MSHLLLEADPAARRAIVDQVNAAGGTYHQLDLGDGLVIRGEYDMDKYLRHYRLPESLEGMTVLDIGTASGYFALECARRGGDVTAIDIWDTDALLPSMIRALDLNIRYVQKNIYDLDEEFGSFDLVVCGSLLLHLPDPFGAIKKIHSVCGGRAVVSTACTATSATSQAPVCEFVGARAKEANYWSYWSLSGAAMRRMMEAAGFSKVEHVDHFTLRSEEGKNGFVVPHVVVSAQV